MITVIEHPPGSMDAFEFVESESPDSRPGWTVHAIIMRQRVESTYVSKSVPTGNGCYNSMSDQVAHTVSYPVYLLRRRVDSALEQAEEKVKTCERKVKESSENEKKANLEVRRIADEMARVRDESDRVSRAWRELVGKQKNFDLMEQHLAKLRDHLGREQFNKIVGIDESPVLHPLKEPLHG